MADNLCRFCLKSSNLTPIFLHKEQKYRYVCVLALVTGLKIDLDDGLPQLICEECTDSINRAMRFRNQCHHAEQKLIILGFKRNEKENIDENKSFKSNELDLNYFDTEMLDDDSDIPGLHPELRINVEFHRLQDGVDFEIAQTSAHIQPTLEVTDLGNTIEKFKDESKCVNEVKIVRNPNKERRKELLGLVEGSFDPNGPVTCKVCKKTLSKWTCFVNHAKLHLGFKFICEFCGKSFISSFQLKRHCRSFHGLKRELKCKYCEYLALDSSQLAVHERRMHTGERPFICDTCSASYFNRKCLLQHLETHRSTNTVQCNHCPQLFKSKRHLSKHRHSVHTAKKKRKTSK